MEDRKFSDKEEPGVTWLIAEAARQAASSVLRVLGVKDWEPKQMFTDD